MSYARAEGMTWDMAEDRAVILDADGATLITLNPVATLLWQELESPSDSGGLVEVLATQFPEAERSQLGEDVEQFLVEMLDEGLLVESTPVR